MKLEIFDERPSILGEGPSSFGVEHQIVTWVDILGGKVFSRHLRTGAISEISTAEHVSFAIPCTDGELLLGMTSEIDRGEIDSEPMRWNDAKVAPNGDLWLGTMGYAEVNQVAALYRMKSGSRTVEKIISGVTVSNGLAWSRDFATMYYIDSPTRSLQAFDFDNGEISRGRVVTRFPESYGYPDGMSADVEGGLWISFWLGSAVRCFDSLNNFRVTEVIDIPVKRVSSSTFAGKDLDSLVITTAHKNDPDESVEAGMVFIAQPGVRGTSIPLFNRAIPPLQ
ncbi:MAG TPA: SMP-30/gluconolactonase/LRE family protein [Candidatus Nanopelagicaceae bacterium]